MMTDEEYIQQAGSKCPFCLSNQVSADRPEADGDYAWAECSCGDCRMQWSDVYTLTGFTPDMEHEKRGRYVR